MEGRGGAVRLAVLPEEGTAVPHFAAGDPQDYPAGREPISQMRKLSLWGFHEGGAWAILPIFSL